MKKTSWKTTLGGLLAAAGPIITQLFPSMTAIATVVSSVGALILGASARDNSVTSEQAGAK